MAAEVVQTGFARGVGVRLVLGHGKALDGTELGGRDIVSVNATPREAP